MTEKTRKIEGIVFKKALTTTRGRDAERYARELREDGYLAKIKEENIGGKTLYVVYSYKAKGSKGETQNPSRITRKTRRITPKTPRLRR